jgi:ribosomal-protein-alanine N-acetyltransferase
MDNGGDSNVGGLDGTLRPLEKPEEAAECARMMASSEPWLTIGRSYDACLEVLRDTGREVYLVGSGEGTRAFLILDMRGPFSGYIQTVCVRTDCRGRGIGRRLIEWAERRILRERPNVFLCVSSFNREAYRLYQRMGYEVVGELKNYLVDGHSEILMRKTSGPWETFRNPPSEP